MVHVRLLLLLLLLGSVRRRRTSTPMKLGKRDKERQDQSHEKVNVRAFYVVEKKDELNSDDLSVHMHELASLTARTTPPRSPDTTKTRIAPMETIGALGYVRTYDVHTPGFHHALYCRTSGFLFAMMVRPLRWRMESKKLGNSC